MTDETSSWSETPVAIIGMACHLPGAQTLDDFWQLLVSGKCAIGQVPNDRLDRDLYYDPRRGTPGKTYTTLAGVTSSLGVDQRDSSKWNGLAASVDPAHWRMCQVAADACLHAGLDPFDLPLRNVGVFVGYDEGSGLLNDLLYGAAIEEAAGLIDECEGFESLDQSARKRIEQYLVSRIRAAKPGNGPRESGSLQSCMVAGVVAKAFRLTGPYLALDSACSSSLQAMLVGARALQHGRVDMALVGGSSTIRFDTLLEFSKAGANSSTGTRPFDANADGVVCSEGCVAIVLKTLTRALSDGDSIHALIRGMGVSCDGRGKGIWAPNQEGQVKAIRRAYKSNITLADVQLIEAHATSTQVGDAVELQSLTHVLNQCARPMNKIAVSSVKANIGHTLEAAGLAGVIKTVLCIENGFIPPAINITQPTQQVDWDSSPLYLPQTGVEWPPDAKPRRAAVDAFGLGGLNMHVVLEDAQSPDHLRATGDDKRPTVDADQGAIAIIGYGCVFPGASNIDQLREFFVNQRMHRVESTNEPGGPRGRFITGFNYDWRRHKIPPKQLEQADPLHFLLLEAVDQAMATVLRNEAVLDRSRVAVVAGCEFPGDFTWQWQLNLCLPQIERLLREALSAQNVPKARIDYAVASFAKRLRAKWPAMNDDSGSFHHSTPASRIARVWDFMGGAQVIDSGSASALAAIATGADLLLAGDCDTVVCCAGHRRPRVAACESILQSKTDGQVDHPRALAVAECEPSEGAGAVVLKRLADARRDGDHVFGILRGIDAAGSDEPADSLQLAMSRALQRAATHPFDVAAIEMDTMASADDSWKFLSRLADVFGNTERNQPVILGSAAESLGWIGAASGMASLLKALTECDNATRTNGEQRVIAVASLTGGLAYCAILESTGKMADHASAAANAKLAKVEP